MKRLWILSTAAFLMAACGSSDYRTPFVGTFTGTDNVSLGGTYTGPPWVSTSVTATVATLNTQEITIDGMTCPSLIAIAPNATTFTLESSNCHVTANNGCDYTFFYDASGGGTLTGTTLGFNGTGTFNWNCTGVTGTDATFTETATLIQ